MAEDFKLDFRRLAIAAAGTAALALAASTPSNGQDAFDWPAEGAPGGAGTLIIAAPGVELATILPGEAGAAGHAFPVLRNVIQTLLTRNTRTNAVEALLATGWEAIDDRHWRFTLRDDVSWHDGTKFNAETAAATLTYMWTPEFPYSGNFVNQPATFSAVDEYTLEVELEGPDPLFAARMTMIPLPSPTQVAEDPESLTTRLVGTGPYIFESWNRGSSIELALNADYFAARPGMYDHVTWLFREESQVRAQLVQAEEANIAVDITPDQCEAAAGDTAHCISFATNAFRFVRPDYHNQTVLKDPRIRHAIAYAIDREGITTAFFAPDATVADNPGPVGMVGFSDDVATYPYDPERARQLVAEAAADGLNVGLPLTVKYRINFFPNIAEVAQIVVTNLNAIGLNAQLQSMPDAEGLAEYRQGVAPNTLDTIEPDRGWIWVAYTSNDLFDFFQPADTLLSCGGRFAVYCNPEFDEQYRAARPLVGEERQEAFEALWEHYYALEVPILPIGYNIAQMLVSNTTEIEPRADGFLPLHEAVGARSSAQ